MIINRWLPLGPSGDSIAVTAATITLTGKTVTVADTGGSTPATLVYQSRSVTSGGSSSRTLSFTCTSAAGQERLVGLVSIASGNPASVTYSSVQIDGQTATQVGSYVTVLDGASNGPTVSFWRATGTSGTSINVTYTIATGAVFDARGALWTLNNAGTLYDSQAATATNTGDINLSLDTDTITSGATAAVFLAYGSSARAATWTGLTERYDGTADDLYGVDWFGAADLDVSSGSTPLTITADLPSDFTGNPAAAGLAVSFNPSAAPSGDSITVTAGAVALTGKTVTLADSVAVTGSALALTGKTITVTDGQSIPVTASAVALTGKTVTVADSVAVTGAALALTGKTVTVGTTSGDAVAVTAGAIALTGKTVTVTDVVNVITVDRATITLSGGIVTATDSGPGISVIPRVGYYDDVGRKERRKPLGLQRSQELIEQRKLEREQATARADALAKAKVRKELEAQQAAQEEQQRLEAEMLARTQGILAGNDADYARQQQTINEMLRQAQQGTLTQKRAAALTAEMSREDQILLEAARREEESILPLLKELLLAYRGKL